MSFGMLNELALHIVDDVLRIVLQMNKFTGIRCKKAFYITAWINIALLDIAFRIWVRRRF